MEILASLTPVSFFSDSFAPRKHLPASSSPEGGGGGRSLRNCGKIGWSLDSFHSQPGRFVFLDAPGRSLRRGCWRGIHLRAAAAAASSGKNGKKPSKGGGKSKGGPEKKDESKKKDNVWSSGFGTDETKPISEKKQDKKLKQNVWRSDVKTTGIVNSDEGGVGGRSNVIVERKKASEGRLQPLVESSNGTTTNVPAPAPEKKNEQKKLEDVDDVTFLRFLSPVLPIEEEILLQPEEPIPDPLWATFCSSSSGVWRGVGAAFSPVTGEFEPISMNENKQLLYDARVLSTVETLRTSEDGLALPSEQQILQRRVLWSLEDRFRESGRGRASAQDDDAGDDARVTSFLGQGDDFDQEKEAGYWEDDEDTGDNDNGSDWEYFLADPGEIDERWENGEDDDLGVMEEIEEDTSPVQEESTDWRSMWDGREVLDGDWEGGGLPSGESENNFIAEQKTSTALSPTSSTSVGPSYSADLYPGTIWTDVMEEDQMLREPGLVFFEDGAYSRGPLELVTDASTSGCEFPNAYTCKVEQCLVAGGHKRLRLVHTVSVEEGEKIEVLRVAVYEEEWMGPCNMKSISDAGGHQLPLFSERARHSPEDLVGAWKVFEVEGFAIHPAKSQANEKGSFVFSCKETSIKRGFPKMPKLTVQEDDSIDMRDFSMSWLTGNVSTYVNLGEVGALIFGIGWVCEDGTRLVMERVYGEDGKLMHVNSKSEIKA